MVQESAVPENSELQSSASHDHVQLDDRSTEAVIAEYSGGRILVSDLMEFVKYNKIAGLEKLRADSIPKLDNEKLRVVALWRAIIGQALKDYEIDAVDDAELLQYCKELYPQNQERAFLLWLTKTYIYDHIGHYTDSEVEEYYQKHKPKYKQPFEFHMRHLIKMTYKSYVVSEADIEQDGFGDLERIAKRISGDESLAANIRMDVPGRPVRYDEQKQWKSLNPGEKLLIPMNAVASKAVRDRLEGILGEVDEGTAFEELCVRHSDSDSKGDVIGPLPQGTRPMLGTLIEMAKKTPVGQVSEIFGTKHGYQVIEVTQKKEEGYKAIKDVKNAILGEMSRSDNQRLVDEVLAMLFDDPVLDIKYDLIIAQGEELTTSTVVARLGDELLTWGDFEGIWRKAGSPKDRDGILERMKMTQPLQMMLIRKLGKQQLEDPDSELSRVMPTVRAFSLGSRFIARRVAEQTFDYITPELQRQFYEENKETMFKVRQKLAYKSIVAMISSEDKKLDKEDRAHAHEILRDKLQKEMEGVRTAEDFLEQAPVLNAPYVARGHRVPESGEPIDETRIYKEYRDQLEMLEQGEFSPVFIVPHRGVASVLLQERIPPRLMELEDEGILDAVNGQIHQRQSKVFEEAMLEKYAARVGFRFLADGQD